MPAGGAPGRVLVIGLGPAGGELLSVAARDRWASVPPAARFCRTDRHPAVDVLGPHQSFDDVYESAGSLEQVYEAIVERLVEAARAHGTVAYAVPGSPLVAERTVELLRAEARLTADVLPALSFLDLAWARLGIDPVAAGVRLVDGQRFAVEAAGARGPLLVAQCDSLDVLSAIKLSVDEAPDEPVVVLQRLGLPAESVRPVPWTELDRAVEADHLTCLWIPALSPPVAAELVRFWELVRTLRASCPWDRAQTPHTLRRYLLEEAYEVLDALDHLDTEDGAGAGHVEEELGDLLFQVVFHAVIAEQEGWFTLADVARGIHDKLVRRHPHVFGDADARDVGTVVRNWDQIKAAEKAARATTDGAPVGPFDGIPLALPALAYAAKVQRRAAGLGVEVEADPTPAFGGLRAEEPAAVGEALFAAVARARQLGVDAEEALRDAAGRFRTGVEASLADRAGRGGSVR